uniref:Hyaluronidase n=1 Tax=Mycoplasmopsis alligatoris TaxID=47687 RepID=Q6R3F5_9BACT|nr:hyaluronidase [Mycoplasmopsis alligatoris A21JP2]
MKNKRKKLLILSSASVLGVVAPLIAISQNSNANQPEVTMKKDYVITPNPHKVTYQEGSFILRDKYSLSKTDIDEATALKLSEITKLKGMTLSNKKNDKVTNITLVDITKNDALKNQVLTKHKADFDAKVFEKIDGHVLIIKDGNITVIGKNADALFYGLVTLLDILKQLNGLELRNLVVEDYADTSIRGFIEGYYGIPWSNEDRMSLMRFGGKLKMTSYIFAPKDDPYHGQKWYELYPPEELEKIKEMSHVGNMSKTRFVWTIHPFMSGRRFGANEANFDKDYASMVAKFEQLYSAGIRQFGVLADDVGSVPRTVVIKMMKKLVEWGKQKGDVYDWVFCPAGYTYAWTDMQELNDYDPEFPKEVQIFWTGDTVTGHINRQTLEHFRRSKKRANQEDRRAPLFWLNWPVNDINKKRMLMGKGEVLHNDITPDDLVGAVTNPMQEAEPSKVAIAAVADYTWNIGAFNADKSWANSFRYIDENVPESLNRLSWHMSDPSPNGHRLVLGESENIVNDLTALSANLKTNTALTQSNMEKIVTEMNLVIEASKDVLVNMKNKRFLEQYTPFAKAISANAKAILGFMEAYKDFNEGNKNTGFAKYVQAIKDYEESHLYQHIIISGLTKTEPGSKRLRPFMEELKTKTSELFNDYVFDRSFKGIQKTTYSTNIKTASKDGSIENIYDKNPETGILFKGAPRKGDEYKVEYALPRTIYGLHIKQAYPNHTSDYFKKYKVEYTSDGKDWKDIENPGKEYTTVDLDLYKLKLDNVKGIRIVNSQDQNGTWTGLKEFEVDFIQKIEKQKPNKAEIEDLILPKDWTFYNGRKENIYDNNLSSYGWLKFPKDTYKVGDTVAIKLKTAVSEGVVNLKLGRHDRDNDRIKKFDLEYTTETQLNNNTVWTKLGSYENDVTVRAKFKSTSNKPVTFIRVKVNEKGNSWVAFRDFSVDLPLELADDPIISNVIYSKEEKKIVIAENDTKLIFDSNDKTSAHFKTNQVDGNQPNNKRDHILKDSYIGVELETLSKIGKVEVIMGRHDTDDDYMKGAVLEYSIDNKTWTELEKYENQRHIIYKSDLSSEPIKAKYLRLKSTKEHKNWIGIREFKVYGYENNFNTVLLTNKQQSTSQVYANYTLNSGNYVVNPTKNITLKNGEFIKVDLLRNSLLKTVELDAANKDKLTGEYSMNDYLYLPFPQLGANPTINARYIRLQNNTGKDLTFDLQRLDIKTVEYAAPSVIFTNMGAENGNDKTSNLFDMDPTTYMKLKNRQKAGEYTIIDMGREIDLKNLKLVTNDSNKDYIRDADIYISTTNKDGDEGWEKVMSIGDGKPDADSDDKILVSFPKHEVSYNTVSNEKINKKARYIKIKMTADYYGRWSQLNEVVWNYEKPEQDYIREYINDTNNRNFLTNTSDLFKNRFYMYKDEDLNTSYISKEKTGTMDWLVSDKEQLKLIT